MSRISRRRFLVGSAALSACSSPAPPLRTKLSMRRPNVLIILLDQLRAAALSVYGNTNIRTPSMDAFLSQGVRFHTAIAANPLCGPARASLLTGMYPGHVGVPNNDRAITPGTPTIATTFRSAGYKAGYIGKWHLSRGKAQYPGSVNGFVDHFQGYNERYAYRKSYWFTGTSHTREFPTPPDLFEPTYQTTQALALLKKWRTDPFLMMVSYVPPHPPKNWRIDWNADFPDAFPYGIDAATLQLRPNVPKWAELTHGPAGGPLNPDPRKRLPGARKFLRNYYGAILAMELEIKRLLEGLSALHLDENTLVVFTSDHGDLGGSHGRYLKQKPYEESVRIPLGFRWNTVLKPRLATTPISQVDIFPTLAGICEVPVPATLHGRDLSGVLLGKEELTTEVLSGCHIHNRARAWWQVRNERFSYTDYVTHSKPPLLFDMVNDPYQLNNLCGDPTAKADEDRLSKLLASRRAAINV